MGVRAVAVSGPGLTTRASVGGHDLILDEPPRLGGGDLGPSPREAIVASVASCVAITVQSVARRRGLVLGAVRVEVVMDSSKAAGDRFSVRLHLPNDLSERHVDHLMRVASKCPVRGGLEAGATFEETVVLEPRFAASSPPETTKG